VPLLEDEHDDPEGGRERERFSTIALIASTGRPERAREQDHRQEQDEPEHVREAAEQRVQEVPVDRREAGERAVRSLSGSHLPGRRPLDSGGGAVDLGEALDERGRPLLPLRWRGRSDDAADGASFAATCLGVAAVLHEDVERLDHAEA
jgi:hypothetical protein